MDKWVLADAWWQEFPPATDVVRGIVVGGWRYNLSPAGWVVGGWILFPDSSSGAKTVSNNESYDS